LEISAFAIAMYVCLSFWVIGTVVALTALRAGVLLFLPMGAFLLAAVSLSFWDDDWMDKEAKKIAEGKRTRATRCPVCATALVLDSSLRWSCPRCRISVVPFERSEMPPPPVD
jgi:hypothetical protein